MKPPPPILPSRGAGGAGPARGAAPRDYAAKDCRPTKDGRPGDEVVGERRQGWWGAGRGDPEHCWRRCVECGVHTGDLNELVLRCGKCRGVRQ